jgi:hypothetical protein
VGKQSLNTAAEQLVIAGDSDVTGFNSILTHGLLLERK